MGRVVSHSGRTIKMVKSESQNKNLTHWAWLGASRYTNEDWLPNLSRGVQRDLPDQRRTLSLDSTAQLPYLKRVTNWKGAHLPSKAPILHLALHRKKRMHFYRAQSSAQLIYWQLTRLWNKPVISVVSLKTEDEVRRSQKGCFAPRLNLWERGPQQDASIPALGRFDGCCSH